MAALDSAALRTRIITIFHTTLSSQTLSNLLPPPPLQPETWHEIETSRVFRDTSESVGDTILTGMATKNVSRAILDSKYASEANFELVVDVLSSEQTHSLILQSIQRYKLVFGTTPACDGARTSLKIYTVRALNPRTLIVSRKRNGEAETASLKVKKCRTGLGREIVPNSLVLADGTNTLTKPGTSASASKKATRGTKPSRRAGGSQARHPPTSSPAFTTTLPQQTSAQGSQNDPILLSP
ncbi:hypothetical protein B0H16DRAFT_1851995 [Mycena metata]|uniref:Uncharacterized protein n=1 Tax=Mycena metata TaxID=1033252 RepID=A0AAD7IN74_9AGAR|nr:hypothetical protein B0H16DRAFT_1851995 [Mycena metata]